MEHKGELAFLHASDTIIWVVNVSFWLEPMVLHVKGDLLSKCFEVVLSDVVHNLVLVKLSENSLALPVWVIWLEWCG